jgi:acyl carrier protein
MPEPSSILGISLLSQAGSSAVPLAPRTAVEHAVLEIWRQVLPAEGLGPASGFFDLGGDSLLATQIVARVRQVFGVELDLEQLLDNPTPGDMAAQT